VADVTRDDGEGVTQGADNGVEAEVCELLRAHGPEVEAILIGMGFPRDVAGSAIHDALLAVARMRVKGRKIESPKAFLVKVAIRSAINALRPLRVKNEIAGSDLVSGMPDPADDFTVGVMVAMDVRRGLRQLSKRQRQALTLCDLAGLSCPDAARVMEISAAGVESNLRRGRQRLREIMLEQGYQPRKREKGDQPRKEGTR
jgi:RNA polymerase sigma-70 factor (ECF subfamily)